MATCSSMLNLRMHLLQCCYFQSQEFQLLISHRVSLFAVVPVTVIVSAIAPVIVPSILSTLVIRCTAVIPVIIVICVAPVPCGVVAMLPTGVAVTAQLFVYRPESFTIRVFSTVLPLIAWIAPLIAFTIIIVTLTGAAVFPTIMCETPLIRSPSKVTWRG